ncbi:MAG: type II toxin-antitoxin system VapC family toxin [Candidatus Aenigmarchaeota archaeon]|nr:type II toxin-antitoxin system VapC family toxin [Candidatus Aenigmarchaeota archaeon]
MKILVDTDIIIDVLRNFRKTIEILKELNAKSELFISGITESEIFSGKDLNENEKREKVKKFLLNFRKINPDNEIFQLAGELRRKYQVSLLDSIIAATACKIEASLLTKNVKDFKKISEIKLYLV